MAESGSKSGSFAKVFQKRVVRTKEKVLQNLGKADRTTDDAFNFHANNFATQQASSTKLQKELKNYVQCVREMSLANRHFYSAIKEAYEPEWIGFHEVERAVESLSYLWEDYLSKLVENVQNPLQAYTSRFPEIKTKIAKRGRKLVDYDHARHYAEQQQNSKKRDEGKQAKSQEELREAKRVYDELNTELHEDLPALYDSRIDALSNNFHSLFLAEAKFSEETSKLMGELADISERLSRESGHSGYKPALLTTARRPDSELNDTADSQRGISTFYNVSLNSESPEPQTVNPRSSTSGSEGGKVSPMAVQGNQATAAVTTNGDINSPEVPSSPPGPEDGVDEQDVAPHVEESTYEPVSVGAQVEEKGIPGDEAQSEALYSLAGETDDIYRVPQNNDPVDPSKLPAGVLFQVQGTHPYNGEDTDELTFDTNDIINVIPFEDAEDQDEGWLYGIKVSTGDKGVFPENFTKRI